MDAVDQLLISVCDGLHMDLAKNMAWYGKYFMNCVKPIYQTSHVLWMTFGRKKVETVDSVWSGLGKVWRVRHAFKRE